MAAKKNTASSSTEVVSDILTVTTNTLVCHVLGTTPIILNRLSEKAKHELLMPRGKKNAAERATTFKHIPVDEFRASAHRLSDDRQPTLLAIPATAFKGSIRTAALDMPGAKKAQIGRLTYVEGDYVGIYGVPRLLMSAVRSADMNKTPDIRTRVIVPEWACIVRVTHVQPLIRAQAVANLLAAAGITVGVGDWRPEKGGGSYGQFRIVPENDPQFLSIIKSGGRAAQVDGMDNPVAYDDESTDLLSWFEVERKRRSLHGVA